MTRVPELASVKMKGCRELGAHLDLDRRGDVQIIIALSQTDVLVWPGSHEVPMAKPKD
jgi:hypothetical protein